MSTIGQVTHLRCPSSFFGESHHLLPIAGVMTCRYCRKDEATIRAEHTAHLAFVAHMAGAARFTTGPRCEADHIDGNVCQAQLSVDGTCPQAQWHASEVPS